jgi:hypothetical protein
VDKSVSDGVTVVTDSISVATLKEFAAAGFGDMVKAVVDIERREMAVGGDLHSDGEAAMLDRGSKQADLWGINLYPDRHGEEDWIEYDSLINIRPRQGNRSRMVEDPTVREAMAQIVASLVKSDD